MSNPCHFEEFTKPGIKSHILKDPKSKFQVSISKNKKVRESL